MSKQEVREFHELMLTNRLFFISPIVVFIPLHVKSVNVVGCNVYSKLKQGWWCLHVGSRQAPDWGGKHVLGQCRVRDELLKGDAEQI